MIVLETGGLNIGGGNVSPAAEEVDSGAPTDVMIELEGGISTTPAPGAPPPTIIPTGRRGRNSVVVTEVTECATMVTVE